MAIQPYPVHDYETGTECVGAVLVCTVSGLPLPVQPHRFLDVDDAIAFEDWARTVKGVRDLRGGGRGEDPAAMLADLAAEWNATGRDLWERDGGLLLLWAIGAD